MNAKELAEKILTIVRAHPCGSAKRREDAISAIESLLSAALKMAVLEKELELRSEWDATLKWLKVFSK